MRHNGYDVIECFVIMCPFKCGYDVTIVPVAGVLGHIIKQAENGQFRCNTCTRLVKASVLDNFTIYRIYLFHTCVIRPVTRYH